MTFYRKLTAEQAQQLRLDYMNGNKDINLLCKKYNLPRNSLLEILRGKSYAY